MKNERRANEERRTKNRKRQMNDYYIHESSYVDDNVTIGKGTKIWHFCHIQKVP